MSTPRILAANRRERHTGPNLGAVILHICAAVLTFVGWTGRRRRPHANDSRPARKLSEIQADLYAEHLMIEQAVATGRMTPQDRERYWRRRTG